MTELAAITQKILGLPVGFLSVQNNPKLCGLPLKTSNAITGEPVFFRISKRA